MNFPGPFATHGISGDLEHFGSAPCTEKCEPYTFVYRQRIGMQQEKPVAGSAMRAPRVRPKPVCAARALTDADIHAIQDRVARTPKQGRTRKRGGIIQQIADELGVSASTIYTHCRYVE